MYYERENRMDDTFLPPPRQEAQESLALLPTFMEVVLDTVERVLHRNSDRNS